MAVLESRTAKSVEYYFNEAASGNLEAGRQWLADGGLEKALSADIHELYTKIIATGPPPFAIKDTQVKYGIPLPQSVPAYERQLEPTEFGKNEGAVLYNVANGMYVASLSILTSLQFPGVIAAVIGPRGPFFETRVRVSVRSFVLMHRAVAKYFRNILRVISYLKESFQDIWKDLGKVTFDPGQLLTEMVDNALNPSYIRKIFNDIEKITGVCRTCANVIENWDELVKEYGLSAVYICLQRALQFLIGAAALEPTRAGRYIETFTEEEMFGAVIGAGLFGGLLVIALGGNPTLASCFLGTGPCANFFKALDELDKALYDFYAWLSHPENSNFPDNPILQGLRNVFSSIRAFAGRSDVTAVTILYDEIYKLLSTSAWDICSNVRYLLRALVAAVFASSQISTVTGEIAAYVKQWFGQKPSTTATASASEFPDTREVVYIQV